MFVIREKREDLNSTGKYERTHPRTRSNLSDCGEGDVGSSACQSEEMPYIARSKTTVPASNAKNRELFVCAWPLSEHSCYTP